jgi:hypothetical protein
MNDKIECKAGVTFLTIEVFGESQHLNPFSINTDQIRYIRKYTDVKGDGWAIIVGQKMYPTRDLNFDHVNFGDVVEIGNTKFECCKTTSLTKKDVYKTLVNYKNVLYIRKYLENTKDDSKNSEKIDKFAFITVDDRVVPFINENDSDIKH